MNPVWVPDGGAAGAIGGGCQGRATGGPSGGRCISAPAGWTIMRGGSCKASCWNGGVVPCAGGNPCDVSRGTGVKLPGGCAVGGGGGGGIGCGGDGTGCGNNIEGGIGTGAGGISYAGRSVGGVAGV